MQWPWSRPQSKPTLPRHIQGLAPLVWAARQRGPEDLERMLQEHAFTQVELDAALAEAVLVVNTHSLEPLLAEGANPNAPSPTLWGNSPLRWAVRYNNDYIMGPFLKYAHRIDWDYRDPEGKSYLKAAYDEVSPGASVGGNYYRLMPYFERHQAERLQGELEQQVPPPASNSRRLRM